LKTVEDGESGEERERGRESIEYNIEEQQKQEGNFIPVNFKRSKRSNERRKRSKDKSKRSKDRSIMRVSYVL
jgi:hypothetical protein